MINNIPNFRRDQVETDTRHRYDVNCNLRVVHFLSTSYPHIVDKFFVSTRYEGGKKKKKNPAKLLDFAGFYEYN